MGAAVTTSCCIVLCCRGGRGDVAVSQLFFMFPDCFIYRFFIYIFIYLIIHLPTGWLHLNHLSVFLFFLRPKMQISGRLDSGDLTDECNTRVFDPSTSSVVFRLFIYSFGFFFFFYAAVAELRASHGWLETLKMCQLCLFLFIFLHHQTPDVGDINRRRFPNDCWHF